MAFYNEMTGLVGEGRAMNVASLDPRRAFNTPVRASQTN